jgi:hypothetical protein
MTMYLSNRDVRPTGSEIAEFIDGPPDADPVRVRGHPARSSPERVEPSPGAGDDQRENSAR